MVANFNDRTEVERFLREANADELNAQRKHLQKMIGDAPAALSRDSAGELMARIAYELRFRVPQSI